MSNWAEESSSFSAGILRPQDLDDDESNLKDNWDDEDEPAPTPAPKPVAKPKEKVKKKLEKEPILILSAEEQAKMKIEAEKRVREVDLELAKEMLGTKISASDVSFTPSTPEQFDNLNSFLVTLVSSLTGSPHFPDFAEKFTRELAISLDTDVLKKMSEVIVAVLTVKNKQKQEEKKAKKSAKGIKKLQVGDAIKDAGEEDLFGAGGEEGGEDDYDEMADKYDFM